MMPPARSTETNQLCNLRCLDQSMSKNGSGIEPSHIAIRQIVPHDASAVPMFEEQLDRHATIIARYGTEWADRLVEEAEAKRRAAVQFAEEITQRASETAADLKAGFERIRAAGRALQEARRQFDLGRVS
jgi:IS5 family transposase